MSSSASQDSLVPSIGGVCDFCYLIFSSWFEAKYTPQACLTPRNPKYRRLWSCPLYPFTLKRCISRDIYFVLGGILGKCWACVAAISYMCFRSSYCVGVYYCSYFYACVVLVFKYGELLCGEFCLLSRVILMGPWAVSCGADGLNRTTAL